MVYVMRKEEGRKLRNRDGRWASLVRGTAIWMTACVFILPHYSTEEGTIKALNSSEGGCGAALS